MQFPRFAKYLVVVALYGGSIAQVGAADRDPQRLIIECAAECSAAAADVVRLGGQVTVRLQNVPALAVTIPAAQALSLGSLPSVAKVAKDLTRSVPKPERRAGVASATVGAVRVLQSADLNGIANRQPANYNVNNFMMGASALHASGILGEGVVVAVIDSGTANNADVVPALAGSVIGGESFIDLPDEPSATSTKNDDHGTWVGSMIAAHTLFKVPTASSFVQALMAHSPESVLPEDETYSWVPMIGTAPGASIYALKVFAVGREGASDSDVLAAMDRVLTLKRNFKKGMPVTPVAGDGSEDSPYVYDALDIKVVNMSLGGAGIAPGLALDDKLTREMLKEGITVVAAAGNEGPSAMTIGSPAAGVGALSVGAVTTAVHDRIWWDMVRGPGAGLQYRPSGGTQTAYFSSRGPTADGRVGVHVLANGYSSFTQGANGDLAWVDGTSFATPTVSGSAALLWSSVPKATAAGVRSALMRGADDDLVQDKSKSIDQGEGFVNLPAALAKLRAGRVDESIPARIVLGKTPQRVVDNIKDSDLTVVEFRNGRFSTQLNLVPGQFAHFALPSQLTTAGFDIALTKFTPALPPELQNQVRGERLYVSLVDAPTGINDLLVDDLISEDTTFPVVQPQSGLLRLAVGGFVTNAGKVSVQLTIVEHKTRVAKPNITSPTTTGQEDYYEVTVPEGTTEAQFQLAWRYDWNYYPALDIDLYVIDPNGDLFLVEDPYEGFMYPPGVTLDAPERVSVPMPTPGVWTLMVHGYELYDFADKYQVWSTDQSGKALPLTKVP